MHYLLLSGKPRGHFNSFLMFTERKAWTSSLIVTNIHTYPRPYTGIITQPEFILLFA